MEYEVWTNNDQPHSTTTELYVTNQAEGTVNYGSARATTTTPTTADAIGWQLIGDFSGASGIEVTDLNRYIRGNKHYLDITVRLFRDKTGDASIQVKSNFNGVETVRDVEITQESFVYTQTVELEDNDQGGYGFVSIPDDRNPADNIWYFSYSTLLDLKTVIISKSANAPLLTLASAPVRGRNMQSSIIDAAQLTANLGDTSLVIVESTKLGQSAQEQLLKFAERGGRVLIFPSLMEGEEIFGMIKPQSVESTDEEKPFAINNWDELDGPLANSSQGEQLPVNKLFVKKRQLPEASGEIIAAYTDGRPFLSRYGRGKGALYYCSAGIAQDWSDLYKGAILVPMISRMISSGSRQYSSVVTETCRFEEKYSNLSSVISNSTMPFKSYAAGVYELDGRKIVLNRSIDEDRIGRLSEEKVEEWIEGGALDN